MTMFASKRVVCLGILCLASAGSGLRAASLILGDPPMQGTGNCDPFGCPGFIGLGTYQQVYLSQAFPGTISISGLTFFESQVLTNGGVPSGGTYTLTFSYTTAAPGDLSLASPGANIGPGSEEFFTGTLPPLTPIRTGNILVITGTPFVYDPADGNLLITVSITGATNSGPALFLNEDQCGPKTFCPPGTSVVSSNAYFGMQNGQPVSGGNDIGGLVTGFDYVSLAVPEPVSWLMVLGGIGLIGFEKRRRNRGISRQSQRGNHLPLS